MDGSRFPWEAVTAITVASTAISGSAIWIISAIVERKLASFLTRLDGTFSRREVNDERHVDITRRLEALERRPV